MTGEFNSDALLKTVLSGRVRKSELLRVLHALDPRYYKRGIPGGSGKLIAAKTEKGPRKRRQSQRPLDLLQKYFALGFALPR